MSPQRRGSKRGSDWKPPRDRREIAIAVLASLAVIVVTAALVWFLRPNRDSGSSSSDVTPTPSTVATPTSTSLPTDTTVAPTTAPAATSTP